LSQDGWQQAVTLGEHLQWVADRLADAELFFGHGTDNAWDEAVFLCLSALELPLDSSEAVLNQVVTSPQKETLSQWLFERVNNRKPLPYLTGVAWFAGKPYQVNEHVLIPRSPLAEVLLAQAKPWLKQSPQRILDLCTGSGCIGIEAAHQFPEALVDLVDISAPALTMAVQNAKAHGVNSRVDCIRSDGFAALTGKRYDLLLLNPPYVGPDEMADMPAEYHHEPALALASGSEGMALTQRLLSSAAEHLTQDGLLFLEVGYSADALEAIYPEFPFVWLEFAQGGQGVTVLSAQDCQFFRKAAAV
jgi:ribosomal protein L3 glutamine methyltransferase